MSLIVSIISQDENFDTEALEKEIPSPHNNLFGSENWRRLLWGHDLIKELGCHQIYSLRDTNVYAYDDAVVELKRELEIILNEIQRISVETGLEKSAIEFRVKNALEVVQIVDRSSGKVGVAIW